MSGWARKRFWKETSVVSEGGGFAVHLDGRALRTPAKAPLVVPGAQMAGAIAQEWDAQQGEVDPRSMPFTRSANAAIDKVAVQHAEVADMLAEYGGSDLLCYRATTPAELVARQAANWDPLLDWAETALGARLAAVSGVMHHPQDRAALDVLRRRVHGLNNFELAAFHDLVSLSGSLIIGFAATLDHLPIEELWRVSRIDETWQEELWGVDEEASEMAEVKRQAFLHAHRFHKMSQK